MKEYTHRANVKKFLPWWIDFVKQNSLNKAINLLEKGTNVKLLNRKDRLGMMQALTDLF